jgi:hypothetical protein
MNIYHRGDIRMPTPKLHNNISDPFGYNDKHNTSEGLNFKIQGVLERGCCKSIRAWYRNFP